MKNIYILPTDKPSRLYLNTQEYIFEEEYSLSTDECQNKYIYITSYEEIKEGDWYWLEKVSKYASSESGSYKSGNIRLVNLTHLPLIVKKSS